MEILVCPQVLADNTEEEPCYTYSCDGVGCGRLHFCIIDV